MSQKNSRHSNKKNVKDNLLWLQQQGRLSSKSQARPTFNNTIIDIAQDNDFNEKGDGTEIFDDLTSSDEPSESRCLSIIQLRRDDQKKDDNKDKISHTSKQCGSIDHVKSFNQLKTFLTKQSKLEPFVIEVIKKFIKAKETGKYINRGIQAEINLNIYAAPDTNLSMTVQQKYLENVYAPLKDVYTVDMARGKRPMTTPLCHRSKTSDKFNNKKPQLCLAVAHVLSIGSENVKQKASNTTKCSKRSHIPKLIINNAAKQNHNTNKLFKNVFYVYESSGIKPKQKELSNHKQLNNTKLDKTPTITMQPKVLKTNQKKSKIPVVKKNRTLETQKPNAVITSTKSNTFKFENSDCSTQFNACGSRKTIRPLAEQKISTKKSIESIKVDTPELNQFRANTDLQLKLPQELPKNTTNNLPISLKQPETTSISARDCVTPWKKRLSCINKTKEEIPTLPVKLESGTCLKESFSRSSHKTAIFRTKKEIEKQKHYAKEIGTNPITFNNLKREISNKKTFLDNTIKYVTSSYTQKDGKCYKKQKQHFKMEGSGQERFILDNKVTYVLKRNPSVKKIKLNTKHVRDKPKIENDRAVQITNQPEQRRNYPTEPVRKYYYPKPSKFATYPRRYEELKRNRNKERAYVLVKSNSNAHMQFSSKCSEPFKIISLEPSHQHSYIY